MKRGSIMFCPKCGAQVPDGSPFCASCGAQLGQQQQVPMNQGSYQSNGEINQMDFNPVNMFNDFKKNIGDFKSLGIPYFLAIGGAALLLLSLVLPYVSALGIISANLFSRGFFYWFFLIIFALATVFSAISKRSICVMASGALTFIWWIIGAATLKSALGVTKAQEAYYSSLITKSVGFWFLLISSLVIIGAGVWGFIEAKKK